MPYILKADQLETQANKVEVLNDDVTHAQYPSARAVKDALADIEISGGNIKVDQEYSPTSENAQSGKAVAEAAAQSVAESIAKASIASEKSGAAVVLDDISPLEHTLKIKATGTDSVIKCGKNLIPYPFTNTTRIHQGILWTDNGDGTWIADGTATAQSYATSTLFVLPKGTYVLSGCPANGSDNTYFIYLANNDYSVYISDIGVGKKFTLNEDTELRVGLIVSKDVAVSNVVFRPQVEIGDVKTKYEPYIQPITYPVNADGTVDGVKSIYPTTVLTANTEGATITAIYNRDVMQPITGAGVGEKTLQDGEIFNDYENNLAIGEHTTAAGTLTRAGGRGYEITNLEYFTQDMLESDVINELKSEYEKLPIIPAYNLYLPGRYFFDSASNQIYNHNEINNASTPDNINNFGNKYANCRIEGPGQLGSTLNQQVLLFENSPQTFSYNQLQGAFVYLRYAPAQDDEILTVSFRYVFSGNSYIVCNQTYNFNFADYTVKEIRIELPKPVGYTFEQPNNTIDCSDRHITRIDICLSSNVSGTTRHCKVGSIIAYIEQPLWKDTVATKYYQDYSFSDFDRLLSSISLTDGGLDKSEQERLVALMSTVKDFTSYRKVLMTQEEAPSDWGTGSASPYYFIDTDGLMTRVTFTKTKDDAGNVIDIEPAYEPNKYFNGKLTNYFPPSYILKLTVKGECKYQIGDIINLDMDYHHYNLFYINSIEYNSETDTSIVTVSPRLTYEIYDSDKSVKEIKLQNIIRSEPNTLAELKLETDSEDAYNYLWSTTDYENGEVLSFTEGSIAAGYSSIACGETAFSHGYKNKSLGHYSFSVGAANEAGYAAGAIGRNSKAIGEYSLVSGKDSLATMRYSTALGERNKSFGEGAFTAGGVNTVTGQNGIALGRGNNVSAQSSVALGHSNTITAAQSGAIGLNNIVKGGKSVALGENNELTANGGQALAAGLNNKISGNCSIALGKGNTVSGNNAVGIGTNAEATKQGSFSIGLGTISTGYGRVVLGRYNEFQTAADFNGTNAPVLVVGSGTADKRKDALIVYGDGAMKLPSVPSDLFSAYSSESEEERAKYVATKGYVDSRIVNTQISVEQYVDAAIENLIDYGSESDLLKLNPATGPKYFVVIE